MVSNPVSIAVCTIGEGSYHAGTGALANSLHSSGYTGTVYIGYRGELPTWAEGQECVTLPGGMRVQFVPGEWRRNPNFEKSALMSQVLDIEPDCTAVAYFDSDIVVNADWTFFEEWSRCGVGLCMDSWPSIVPQGHPWRAAWAGLADELGLTVRPVDYYCNAGFVMVPREHRVFLQTWARAVDAVLAEIGDASPGELVKYGGGWEPYSRSDQDALAVAMMGTDVPLSIVGTDGMSFSEGANLMTHAVNKPKPWARHYVREAIVGLPPLLADRMYWSHAAGPLPVFDRPTLHRRRRSLRLATLLSSVFRRPRFWAAG